ncbi:MAG: putative porin [Kiritimatiellia bacterium]
MKQVKMAMAGVLMAASLGETGMAQSPVPAPAPKTWVDTVTFKGDLRYRYESINDESKLDADKDVYTRQRDRIRARLGAEAKCNDNLKAGIEFSTGQSDPVSGNQSLGDGFGKKEFRLNLAYFDYNLLGDNPNEVHLIAGKMKNPFITLPDDLVWDGDLTPEGLGVKSQIGGGFATLFANGGYMWVQERSDRDDLMLYAGQTAVKLQFKPEVGLTLGASYYGFQEMEGNDVIDWESKNNSYGNSTVSGTVSGSTTNKAYAMEYTPVVVFAQLELWVAGKPLTVFAQELQNGDADDFDKGHLYGVTLGKAKNLKSWEVGYTYSELEKDSTVGMFTDSDRWGGGTDGKGHKVFGKYQIMKNLQAGVAYYVDEKKISDSASTKDYDRLQLDLVASF